MIPLGDECLSGSGGRGWRGEWANRNGKVVTYAFGDEAGELRGKAVYAPRAVADDVRAKIRAFGRHSRPD